MRILVTAFDPFGGDAINPALEAARGLESTIAGADVSVVEVPTVFGDAITVAAAAIDAQQPDAVLCLGQAGGRFDVTPERVAINLDDARIADNAGNQPIDVPIAEGGPAAYFSTLPIKAIVAAIREAGLPSSVSNTAGTFVCNHIMYGVLHHLATTGRENVRAGFMHVPFIPEQVVERPGTPAMSTADITRAVTAAITAIATHEQDVHAVEGATH